MKLLTPLLAVGLLLIVGCSEEGPLQTNMPDPASFAKVPEGGMEFTMFLQQEELLNPECISFTEDGWFHMVGCRAITPVTGDFVGEESSTLHLVVRADGNGHAGGSFTFDITHEVLGSGTFEGNFEGEIVAGVGYRGRIRARGTSGDFVGLKMFATSTNTPEEERPFVVTGTIW